MKKEIFGTSNNILEIDVSSRTYKEIQISDEDRRLYLGGKGLGLKLLYDRLKPEIDPLGKENIIIFTTGVILGTGAPNSGRFSAVTKSPLTGIITSSSCGGPFGMALKTSGWDGIIVKGTSSEPVLIKLDSNSVEFIECTEHWGKDTIEIQKVTKQYGTGAIVIGPAGENLVKYANIASGHRFLGRGGMGAVLGSKKIKGIIAKGKEFKIVPIDKKNFKRTVKKATSYINNNLITSRTYRDYGTVSNVEQCNKGGILPVRNFTSGSHKDSYMISGQYYKEKFNTKYYSCKQCAILCGHKGSFSTNDPQKQKVLPVPEYETAGLMGSNLEIFDAEKIAEWNDICGRMGMDTISAGGTLGWAMEAGEKNIFKTELKFGKTDHISDALNDIAYRKGKNKELADGSRFLSEKYGGKDFAIHVKGLEMGAYDPRGTFGMGLNYAVANRGACHLSTAIFSLEVFFNLLSPDTNRSKAPLIKFFENFNTAINSLHTCQFTAYAYTLEPFIVKYVPAPILKFFMQNIPQIALKFLDISIYPKLWSSITGIKLSSNDLLKAGERVHILERYMNTREGISKKDDILPGRLLNEPRKDDPRGLVIKLDKMLKKYYQLRGYDDNGIPKKEILEKLKII